MTARMSSCTVMPLCLASLSSSLNIWSFRDCMNLGRGVAPAVSLDIRGNLAVRGEKASVTQNPGTKGRFLPSLKGVKVNASLGRRTADSPG